jgi:hypothetical protein
MFESAQALPRGFLADGPANEPILAFSGADGIGSTAIPAAC